MKDEEEGHESLARRDRGRCEKVDRTFNDNMEQDTVMMNIQWTFNGGGNPIDDGRNDDGRVRKSFEEKNEHQDQDWLNILIPKKNCVRLSFFLKAQKEGCRLNRIKIWKWDSMVKNVNMWGTLFLGGQPAGTQQGDFCVTWKGGGALDNRGHCAAAL